MNAIKIKRLLRKTLGTNITKLVAKFKHQFFPKEVSQEELAYIKQMMLYISENQTVVDIGANEGLWTKALAEKVGDNGQVIAFEPVKDSYRILTQETQKYKNVKLLNIGLSTEKGTAQILRDPISTAPPSAAIKDTAKHINNAEYLMVETIEISTLDDVFGSSERAISFIKIDVEGHEEMVVAGGIEFFKKQKPVLFLEILREYWYPGKIGNSRTADILLKLGYSMCQVTPNQVIRSSTEFERQYENFLFLPLKERI
jgi:FkbM family methyltransferase